MALQKEFTDKDVEIIIEGFTLDDTNSEQGKSTERLPTIQELADSYHSTTNENMQTVKQVSSSVSMLQTSQLNEDLAKAVVMLEGTANKGESKWFSKLPFVSKYVDKASEGIRKESIKNGSVVGGVESLFKALSDKKDNIETVANTLFDLREGLIGSIAKLEEQQEYARLLAGDGVAQNADQFKARNLLVELGESIVTVKSQMNVIDNTIQAAQASVSSISALIPRLELNLVTELNINASLQELKEFNQVYKQTNEFVKGLSLDNNTSINETLSDIMDLAINTGDSSRMLKLVDASEKTYKVLENKKQALLKEQVNTIETLADSQLKLSQQTNNMLDYKGA